MKSKSHLASVGESYFQHMWHALSFTLEMLVGAACCLVHAIFPFMFEHTGSQIVNRLHDRMVVNRAKLSSRDTEAQAPDAAGTVQSS